MLATSGYSSRSRGCSSVGTTVFPCTNLEALAKALMRGATLSSSPSVFATWITNVTISSGVVPLDMPNSAATWEILSFQRCGAPCGLNATVSSIWRYIHPTGVYLRRPWQRW